MSDENYPHLFQPITVKGMRVRNRTSMAPMGTNYACQNGEMSLRHIGYYEQRAAGGTGLIIVENANVSWPAGSNGTTQLRIDHDSYIPRLYQLTETLHRHGACVAVQINHAGASAMESRTGVQPVSASNIPSKTGGASPRPLSREELETIARQYGEAARRAKVAGFDAVEVHGGHSYLLCQFLSPTMNDRTDEFGGSAENRARFPRMVLDAVRAQVGEDFPIIFRLSADERVPGGNTIDDSLELLEYLIEQIDIVDVSCGLNDTIDYQIDSCRLPDGWRAFLSRAVRERFGKPTITTGNIRDPKVAEEILARGDADFVGMGRGLIAEPCWARKVAEGREDELRKCISCNVGCTSHRIQLNRPIRCTVNPQVDTWETYRKQHVTKPCNVVVIGGGTAGLEAACTAAEVGCTVHVIEKQREFGGLARRIALLPDKFRIQDFVDYQVQRAERLQNVFLLSGMEATPELVNSFKPDIVVNATGSEPLLPPIEGLRTWIDRPYGRVHSIAWVMDHVDDYPKDMTGQNCVVIGGGAVGLDVVEFVAERGAKVQVIEMAPTIGTGIDLVTMARMRKIFDACDVTLRPSTALTCVGEHSFVVKNPDETSEELPFDYGFVCIGMKSASPQLVAIEGALPKGTPVVNVGDAVRARRIIEGTTEGRNILDVLKGAGYL